MTRYIDADALREQWISIKSRGEYEKETKILQK